MIFADLGRFSVEGFRVWSFGFQAFKLNFKASSGGSMFAAGSMVLTSNTGPARLVSVA